jgi:hypothetical protein
MTLPVETRTTLPIANKLPRQTDSKVCRPMDEDHPRSRQIKCLQLKPAPENVLQSVSLLNDEARRIVRMIEAEHRNHEQSNFALTLEDAFILLHQAYREIDGSSRTNISVILQLLLTNKGELHHHHTFCCVQQPVYDEGIRCFPHLLSIEDDLLLVDSPTLDSADSSAAFKEAVSLMILLYNAGQIRLHQHRYNEALTHFMDASIILKLVDSSISTNEGTFVLVGTVSA